MPESVKRRGASGPPIGAIVDRSMSSVAMDGGYPRRSMRGACRGALSHTGPVIAPYGSWDSPLSTDALVAGEVRLGAPAFTPRGLVWTERRPAEGGRTVLVGEDGDLFGEGFDVRTRVHEYGGGAWVAAGEEIVFSDDADGRLYRLMPGGGAPEPIT